MNLSENLEIDHIEGVKITRTIKYLGMSITKDRKEMMKTAEAQIRKNIGRIKWRLRKADAHVKSHIICCFARTYLIYFGVPMVSSGIWNREHIRKIEERLYREAFLLPRDIKGNIITNLVQDISPAWKTIERLSKRVLEQNNRQPTLSKHRRGTDKGKTEVPK